MSIYNGPSEGQFVELMRTINNQYNQVLALRADIQELITLMRAIACTLSEAIKTQDKKDDK